MILKMCTFCGSECHYIPCDLSVRLCLMCVFLHDIEMCAGKITRVV